VRIELGPGRKASYQVLGTGEPALLFEGGPGISPSLIFEHARLLQDVFTCYVIDPHGSRDSTPPNDDSGYTPEGHARFYNDVRRALGLDAVTILGHSFGSVVALTFASLFPETTARCIAVSPFVIGADVDDAEGGNAAAEMEAMLSRHAQQPWYEEARRVWDGWTERALAADDPNEVADMLRLVMRFYVAHPDRPEVAAGIARLAQDLEVDLRAIKVWEGGLYQTIDLRPHLARIAAPTRVVTGEKDLIGGPAQARVVVDAVPGATLAVIGDCGHLVPVEVPDAYRDAIVDWL